MKSFLIGLALTTSLVVAGAACKKEAAPSTPPVQNTTATTPPGSPDVACTSDDDCTVTCARPQECCDQLCPPCEQAMLKTELAVHEEWRARSCDPATCPVAKCMAPTEETFARCDAGKCVVERRPVSGS